MNLPNLITLSRLALAIPFLLLLEWNGYERIALVIFVIASLTDWVDGYLARKWNQVTPLGQLLDPLVDKLLVTGALVALCARGIIPAWSVTLILFREFLVTGLRALEASRGVIVQAGWWGKWKAAIQMIAIILLLAALDSTGLPVEGATLAKVATISYWFAVGLTVASGIQYGLAAKHAFSNATRPSTPA
ncbi:MAG: CDP-diacylglycerol--glycerol-3-phosphate 3-phosphatidyltransferase [Candidatus Sericytochromatia bacterium]|nr:CDP-diacylglycerol--glycerol-3-phosphate 3-phosphatidyltransferase [Candidatus Sericytochromatia bacterium]